MRDAAVAVECDPLKRDNTDMSHMLAADGSQNGKYVSLAHQSGAAMDEAEIHAHVERWAKAVRKAGQGGYSCGSRP